MGLIDNAIGLAKENVGLTAIGAGVVGIGAGLGAAALIGSATKKKTRKSSSRRKRIKHTKRGLAQDRKRRSKQKWEVAYQKRKRKHHSSKRRKGIHYTKKGQPYIIMASGKARFVKKTKRRAR